MPAQSVYLGAALLHDGREAADHDAKTAENYKIAERLAHYQTCLRRQIFIIQQMAIEDMSFFLNPNVDDLEEPFNRHRNAHMWLYSFDVTDQEFTS